MARFRPKVDVLAQLAPLRLMLLAILVFRTGCVLLPFYGLYLVDGPQLSAESVVLVIGCFGFGGLVADMSMPATLSWLSPGRAIPTALLVQAAALVVAVFATNLLALMAVTVVWGFSYEMVNPACYTVIAKTVDQRNEKLAFAVLRLCINVGMGLGPAIGSLIYAAGQPHLLFVLNALMGLVAATMVRVWARNHEDTGAEDTGVANAWYGGWRDELRFWGFQLTAFPAQLAFGLPTTVMSLYIVQELRLSPLVAGVVLFLNAAMIVAFELPLNILTNHWRNISTIVIGVGCSAVGFGIIGMTPSVWLLAVSTVVWTVGEMIIGPAFLGYVREISTPSLLVRNMGIFSGGVNAGLLLAPVAYALAQDSPIPGRIWTVVAGLLLVSVLVFGSQAWRRGPGNQSEQAGLSAAAK